MADRTQHWGYEEEHLYLVRETFTGTGAALTFQLTGNIGNATFERGEWEVGNVETAMAAYATKTTGAGLYDSILPLVRNKISVSSISVTGLVTLTYAPMAENFYIWYWYDLAGDAFSDYYRDDFVAFVEGDEDTTSDVASDINVDTTSFNQVLSATDDDVQTAFNTLDDAFHFSNVRMPAANLLGSPTYTTLHDWFNNYQSPGRVTGGTITDGGSSTVNIAAGTGYIRASDSDVADLLSFNWSAATGVAITAASTRFIGVNYNSGSPNITAHTSFDFNLDTDFPLGRVVNEVINDAATLHILNDPWWVGDPITNILERVRAQGLVIRDATEGGLIISSTGTRCLAMTAGKLWSLLNEHDFAALDTNVSGTFEYYWYKAGSGWQYSDQTQLSNVYYNDVTQTALVALGTGKFVNAWVYAEADDEEVAVLYGQAQYSTLAQAQAQQAPTNVPQHISQHGILLGRFILKQGTDTIQQTDSAFSYTFTLTSAADHGNLAGLGDDDHTQYVLVDGTRTMTGSLTVTGTVKLSTLTDGYVPYHVADATGLANSPIWTDATKVGIGTATVPHGAVGAALLAIEGADASALSGPHVQFTTALDDYPLLSFLNYTHDSVWLCFDCYYDGAFKSSDDTSNFVIAKTNNTLAIKYAASTAPGNAVTFYNGYYMSYGFGYSYFPPGFVYIGASDSQYGSISLYGHGTGSAQGGRTIHYLAADHDGTIDYYILQAYENDFLLGPDTDTDALKMTAEGLLVFTMSGAAVGIGTATVPHGAIGAAKLAIEGTNASTAGPHVQFTTASDDYPLLQIVPYAHDNVVLVFDAYYDGAWKSSDAGSNFRIFKNDDSLFIGVDTGIAQGGAVTFDDIWEFDSDGIFYINGPLADAAPAYGWISFGLTYDSAVFTGSGVDHSANKLVFYDSPGSWVGGMGISGSCVNFYSGDHFKWVVNHTGTGTGTAGMLLYDGGAGVGPHLIVGAVPDTMPLSYGMTVIGNNGTYGTAINVVDLNTAKYSLIALAETINATPAYLVRYNSAHATNAYEVILANAYGLIRINAGASNTVYDTAYFAATTTVRNLYIGVFDSVRGQIELTGHATGEATGGSILFYTSADHDTTIDYFLVSAEEDDFLIGPNTDTDALKLTADKDLLITAGTIGISDLTDGRIPYSVSDTAGLANTNIFTNATNVSIGRDYAATTVLRVYGGTATNYPDCLTIQGGSATAASGPAMYFQHGYAAEEWQMVCLFAGADGYGVDYDCSFNISIKHNTANNWMQIVKLYPENDFANMRLGVADTTAGVLRLQGHATGTTFGGTVHFHTGADHDTTIDYFQIAASSDDLIIGPDTDTDALKLSDAKDLYLTDGDVYIQTGGTTRTSIANGILSLGTDDAAYGNVICFSQNGQGGFATFYTAADADDVVNLYYAGANGANFTIGSDTNTDLFKINVSTEVLDYEAVIRVMANAGAAKWPAAGVGMELYYDTNGANDTAVILSYTRTGSAYKPLSLYSSEMYVYAGANAGVVARFVSDATVGNIQVGTADTVRGQVDCYGHATGQATGGGFVAYTSADHDTTIDYYAMLANEDDLTFGPSTDLDALRMTAEGLLVFTMSGAKIGIITATVPHGGIGAARFAIDGTDASTDGPHIQLTTAADDYPLLQILGYQHDLVTLCFDCYYDGAWKSADAGSNYMWIKYQDKLEIWADTAVAQGAAVGWNTCFTIDKEYKAYIPIGPLYIGQADTLTGGVHLYGFATGSAQGGYAAFYTAADHDTTIDYFLIEGYEDDLYIGPNTDTDALKLTSDKDLYLTAGDAYIYGRTANVLTLGSGAAGVDYILTFNGENNDGTITYLEDEAIFRFNSDLNVRRASGGTGAEFLRYETTLGWTANLAHSIAWRDNNGVIGGIAGEYNGTETFLEIGYFYHDAAYGAAWNHKIYHDYICIGTGEAGIDYYLKFDGENNDTTITWKEDEDYLEFADDLLISSAEKIQFRDTAIYIASNDDGHLDLMADVSIDLNTGANTDLVVNFFGTTNSGSITWMEDEAQFYFSNSIYITNTAGTQAILWSNGSQILEQIAGPGTLDRLLVLPNGDVLHVLNEAGTVYMLKVDATGVTIGGGVNGVDYALTFDGNAGDGVITWMEDEDTFTMSCNLKLDASSYFNFGASYGTDGYGIRDNAGTMEYKNSGGAWAGIGTGGATNPLNVGTADDTPGVIDILSGGNTEAGGCLKVELPPDQDATIAYYAFQVAAGTDDLYIGPDTDTDALKLDQDGHFYITGTNANFYVATGGIVVGTNDTNVGSLILYGGGAGLDGGTIKLYLGADDDATISYYGIQVDTDDLFIGPSTNLDALLLDHDADFHITAGSLILDTASEYINFGAATQGSTGYGLRDNAGVMEVKNSGGSWAAISSPYASFTFTHERGRVAGGSYASATAWQVRPLTKYRKVDPPVFNDTYVKATSEYSASYKAYMSCNGANSLLGTRTSQNWLTANTNPSRFHIDLGQAEVVTRVYYENSHESGGNTTEGAQNFTMWGSNEATAFAELTYATDTDWTQLTTSVSAFDEHTGSNVEDPKFFTVTNTTAYRYYAFKCADNWGSVNYIGMRRIVLMAQEPNTIAGASINDTTYIITLPAGTYFVNGQFQTYQTVYCRTRLYDNTNSKTLLVGLADVANGSGYGNGTMPLTGVFTLAAATDVKVDMVADTASTTYGLGIGDDTSTNVFGKVTFLKIG